MTRRQVVRRPLQRASAHVRDQLMTSTMRALEIH
jgi:hypothetical protein